MLTAPTCDYTLVNIYSKGQKKPQRQISNVSFESESFFNPPHTRNFSKVGHIRVCGIKID